LIGFRRLLLGNSRIVSQLTGFLRICSGFTDATCFALIENNRGDFGVSGDATRGGGSMTGGSGVGMAAGGGGGGGTSVTCVGITLRMLV